MSWWLSFWLIAMIISESQECLKCSPEAMQVLNELKGPYLDSKLRGEPELRTKLQQLLETNVEGLSWHQPQEGKYMGNIDEITLQQLASHFKRSMNRIMENQFDDGQLFNEITWSLQNLHVTFEKLLTGFQKVFCSNECGYMRYLFISCYTCKTNTYSCTKKFHCGERKIKVETDDDLILDCALRWHKYSYGVKTYAFYRVVDGKEQKMTTTMDSFLVKKEANANDTGRYRCKMFGSSGYSSSQLDFQVTVVPSVGKTTWFPRPQSTLEVPLTMGVSSRAPPPQPDWTVWIVIGTTGGLLFIIVAAFVFYYRHQNEKEAGESSDDDDDDDDDEEDNDESESSE
ncbi:izumo sperm-egg fusion protein 1 [Eublepharis macularius]|uniref:Izumo sperm-egg fusion protein 1 n=1 Tax=Eublepharis macularius TaxID=481883 RepID=A0AA97K7P5_EUBMA|nr:izumo sperm-egg fusion protein 1 [Eublepharis macularius]